MSSTSLVPSLVTLLMQNAAAERATTLGPEETRALVQYVKHLTTTQLVIDRHLADHTRLLQQNEQAVHMLQTAIRELFSEFARANNCSEP